MNRRAFIGGALGAFAGVRISTAQTAWPTAPIRLIVPYAAGGPTDVAARLLSDALSRKLPQRVIVENITGAGTVVGTGRVASAKDSHTFLVATVAHTVNPVLFKTLPFDPAKDFTSVALIGTVPQIVLVKNDLKTTTIPELIALARAKPGGLSYGSAGIGSAQHLAAELFKNMAKVDIVHVPYRGSGPAVTDLLAGTLDLVIDSAATALQHMKGGSVRALAVTTQQRLPAAAELPTVADTLPGYEAYTWNAILAPSELPPSHVMAMNAAINSVLGEPELAARLTELGVAISKGSTPETTNAFIAQETQKWQKLMRDAGVQPN